MDDPRGNPLVELFNQTIHDSFFTVLRTQEQLGMRMHCAAMPCHAMP
jgi:secreted Zn-dependent insulinase-like peptidase